LNLLSGNNTASDAGGLYYGIKLLLIPHTDAHLTHTGLQNKACMAYARAALPNVIWPGWKNINGTPNKVRVDEAEMLGHKHVRIIINTC
jgi:hypothetical protein